MKKVIFCLVAAAIVLTTGCKKDDDTVKVISVSLDRETLGLVLGHATYNEATLNATINPTDATNKKLSWTSSDASIASVSNGVVTAVRLGGPVTITVTTEDGGHTATCAVTVTENIVDVTGVTIEVEGGGEFEVEEDATITLKAVVTPSNATRPSITWGSSNDDIATVNVNTGVVTGKTRNETVTISVSVSTPGGGQASKSCDVKVLSPGVLNQPSAADIWYVYAKLTWKDGFDVDSISVTGTDAGSTYDVGTKLSEAALEALSFNRTGLEPDKNYRATIYFNKVAYNSFNFKTPAIPLDGVINVPGGDDFSSFFNNYAQKGWIFNLAGGGAEYSVGRLRISNSVTIKGGEGGTKFINTNNYKMFGNGDDTNTMEILFEGIDFYGGNADMFNVDAVKTDGPSINVKSFTIKNCTVENFTTSFFRTGDAEDKIDELIFENCLFRTASGTGRGIFDCTSGAKLGKFTIKDCTFDNLNGVIRWTNLTTVEPIVSVETSTFYNVGNNDAANPYLFNMQHSAAKVTVTKSLFTKGKQDAVQTARIAATETVASTDNFGTTDYTQAESYAIDLTPYEGDANALFVSPANGNFNFKDTNFAGKDTAGDPTRDRSL